MSVLEPSRLADLVEGFSKLRLLVVGDLVVDGYVWGDADRVSPEAPVPVVKVSSVSEVLGGAANVARNAVALGASASFCGVVGDDDDGRRAAVLLDDLGVDPSGLVCAEGRPTTRKTRVIARSQQLVRFDRETTAPLAPRDARALEEAVARAMPGADGAVAADYGKGVLAPGTATAIMALFREAGLPVVVDPKDSVTSYRGAALLKPNLREAEKLSGIEIRGAGDLGRAVAVLRRDIGGGAVVVTKGGEGMSLFDADENRNAEIDVPTVGREVYDVQGAGDTVSAALALSLRAGSTLLEAAVIANAAASVVVGKIGTATADADEVRELLPAAIAAAGGRS
ncbi:MAG: bifunctional hydroxymethylpyrimidine kinase/phosphomethylpyrimidine kinase [Myxococcales bacterium]|nr:bifunctional hydroxymethylpyrimidine kinase/phosphomethylpyrimidine kinase [Myxococcales bacterium]